MEHSTQLLIYLILFSVIGLAFVWSASLNLATQRFDDPFFFIKRQVVFGFSLGWLSFFILSRINPDRLFKISLIILLFNLTLLALTVLQEGPVKRWFTIGELSFQPGELMKFSVAIFFAHLFRKKTGKQELLIALLIGLVTGLLFYLQPAVSNFLIVLSIGLTGVVLGGLSWRKIGLMVFLTALIIAAMTLTAQYRIGRFQAFLNPQESYHLTQARLAIGSGGLFGLGFGKGKSKLDYLPQAANDSIFAVIAEETGFFGATLLVAFYLGLSRLLLKVARQVSQQEKIFLGALSAWVAIQSFIHIGSNLGLIPPTGTTLPFISYGSSSLVSLFIAFGLAHRIIRKKMR